MGGWFPHWKQIGKTCPEFTSYPFMYIPKANRQSGEMVPPTEHRDRERLSRKNHIWKRACE